MCEQVEMDLVVRFVRAPVDGAKHRHAEYLRDGAALRSAMQVDDIAIPPVQEQIPQLRGFEFRDKSRRNVARVLPARQRGARTDVPANLQRTVGGREKHDFVA